MANATDVITYIGIPLAVLGVLPILYTSLLAILNQRRIRRSLLHHGHRPATASRRQHGGFTIRSSPMTTLIEVELPKYAVAPFERADERYWKLASATHAEIKLHDQLLERSDSSLSTIEEGRVRGFLRGGSWRAFQWKKITVGKKLYRIQYVDELREPPAEVDFTELVHYLLDWGTELDPMGWEKLRSGGLWTPAGTVLLRLASDIETKDHNNWVLRTSMPDESDGVLSLCVRWPENYREGASNRGATSLPPGWGRLNQPILMTVGDDSEDKKDLATRIEQLRLYLNQAADSTSFRLKVGNGSVSKVYWEHKRKELGTSTDVFFPSLLPQCRSWFSPSIASLLLVKSDQGSAEAGILWGFELPLNITTFALKDTIPVGVLVLLEILPEDDAPQWTTAVDPSSSRAQQGHDFHNKFVARNAAIKLESSMPPAQAAVAKQVRMAAELREMMDTSRREAEAREEYEHRRMQDAIVSARMSNKAVVALCKQWLIQNGHVPLDWTLCDIVEATLYMLVLDQNQTRDQTPSAKDTATDVTTSSPSPSISHTLLTILHEWTLWSDAGGMKREQYHMLRASRMEFCLAACMVGLVREATVALTSQQGGIGGKGGVGKASVDMLECLDLWRKVRLG